MGLSSVILPCKSGCRLLMILLSFPTPVGSIIRYSGDNPEKIVSTEFTKLSFMVQQTQPSMNSRISSFFSPFSELLPRSSAASMLLSPYSFSRITGLVPVRRMSSLIKVVLPAPKKPETIRMFIEKILSFNRRSGQEAAPKFSIMI